MVILRTFVIKTHARTPAWGVMISVPPGQMAVY